MRTKIPLLQILLIACIFIFVSLSHSRGIYHRDNIYKTQASLIALTVKAINWATDEPVKNVKIDAFKDSTNALIASQQSDTNGVVNFQFPSGKYIIKTNPKSYWTGQVMVELSDSARIIELKLQKVRK